MRLPAPAPNVRTVADVLVETLVCGMVGHSNLGFAADGPAMLHVTQDPELL